MHDGGRPTMTAGPLIETTGGTVRGTVEQGIHAFRGIPYGGSTAGPLRFLPPRPRHWPGVLAATRFGARSPQIARWTAEAPHLVWNRDTTPMGEDCLVLNVWSPTVGPAGLPVMVFLHGGGYQMGSSGPAVTEGGCLASRGVVVVSLNHRLNVFGFLHLADAGDERYRESVNVGMLDIVAALRWVRDNIAAFGGDPGNVTVFGQSGGGSKVGVLMAMPAARGLFHRAIAQSASSMRRMATPEEAAAARDHLLAAVGLRPGGVAALAELPTDRLLAGMQQAVRDAGGIYDFRPVVDGTVLPTHPFDPLAPALGADVPMIVGWCETEQRLRFSLDPDVMNQTWASARRRIARFVGIPEDQAADLLETYRQGHPDDSPGDVMTQIYGDHRYRRTAIRAAELRAEAGHAATYAYRLSWRTPVGGGLLRSPHTLCLPFVFGTTDAAVGLVGEGDEQRKLEQQMADAWVAFARTGDPNHPGLAPWRPYSTSSRTTMVFDSDSRSEDDPGAAERRALEGCPPYLANETEGGRRT